MRCFLAIDVPATPASRLAELIAQARKTGVAATYPDKSGLHLTLAFFGERTEVEVARMRKGLEALSFPSFQATVSGTGFFPSAARPRVWWAGVHAPELFELHRAACEACGVPSDPGFHPHVTLSRIRDRPPAAFFELAVQSAKVEFGPFPVRVLSFKESRLSPKGVEYAEIFSAPLAAHNL